MKQDKVSDGMKSDKTTENTEQVNHPKHYNSHPSGVECIDIARHYTFDIGNAIKYLWRHGLKLSDGETDQQAAIRDLKKAIWYIEDEIQSLGGTESRNNTVKWHDSDTDQPDGNRPVVAVDKDTLDGDVSVFFRVNPNHRWAYLEDLGF